MAICNLQPINNRFAHANNSEMSLDKLIIALLLVLMLGSLGSAFYYMYKDRGRSTRTVKALTARVSIWVLLFALIVGGIYTGWITPSNTIPIPRPSAEDVSQ